MDPSSTWFRKKAFSDIQVVTDESAKGTYCLIQKQLMALGCPPLKNDLKPSTKQHREGGEDQEMTRPVLRCFLCTSDGGADQSRFKKLCGSLVEKDELTLFVTFNCFMHAAQLIVKTGLTLVDAWLKRVSPIRLKYFATLAKLAYCWRDMTRTVYKVWAKKLGTESAITYCATIIPKCIAGRWGSIADVERYLLARRVSNMIAVLPEAFGLRVRRGPVRSGGDGGEQNRSIGSSEILPLQDIVTTTLVEEGCKGQGMDIMDMIMMDMDMLDIRHPDILKMKLEHVGI